MNLPNIQIARGIAATLVVIAHANLIINKDLFNGFFIVGWSGVDFFFVISGFIIFLTNQKYFENKSNFTTYAKKRLIRVIPAYWICLTIFALILYVMFERTSTISIFSSQPEGFAIRFLKSLFLLPTDIHSNEYPMLPVAWTLTYEMMFYLLFAACFFVSRRLALIFGFIWLSLIVARITSFIEASFDDTIFYIVTEPKNIEFLLGCLTAHIFTKYTITDRNRSILLVLGITTLAVAWINTWLDFIWFGKNITIQFGLPFFLITLAIAKEELKTNYPSQAKKFFIFIGDASYSIYLTHYPLLLIFSSLTRNIEINGYILFFCLLTITIFLGLIFYKVIEKPITNYAKRKFLYNRPKPASEAHTAVPQQ